MRRLAACLLLAVLAVLAPAAAAQALDRAALGHALGREMARAGSASGAYVRDLATDEVLFSRRAATPRIPASVQKLVTTATALRRMGPAAVLRTAAVTEAPLDGRGVLRGDLVLRGGGDPTLSRPALAALARRLRDEVGLRRVAGSVLGDETAFDHLRGSQRTGGAYDPDMGGVLSALAVGRGWSRDGRPAAEAARRLAGYLRRAGVRVDGPSGESPGAPAARTLAAHPSPALAALARAVNVHSSNFGAEMLLKAVAAHADPLDPAGTAAGAALARAEIRRLGVSARVADGSGLSRANRIAPREVVDLLDGMQEDVVAGPAFVGSLPVAGRTGTLQRRMRGTAAAGRCRAKTGSINGVSALAGFCATRDEGRCRAKTGSINGVSALAGFCATRDDGLVAFAFLMNATTWTRARRLQDRMTAALARLEG